MYRLRSMIQQTPIVKVEGCKSAQKEISSKIYFISTILYLATFCIRQACVRDKLIDNLKKHFDENEFSLKI